MGCQNKAPQQLSEPVVQNDTTYAFAYLLEGLKTWKYKPNRYRYEIKDSLLFSRDSISKPILESINLPGIGFISEEEYCLLSSDKADLPAFFRLQSMEEKDSNFHFVLEKLKWEQNRETENKKISLKQDYGVIIDVNKTDTGYSVKFKSLWYY